MADTLIAGTTLVEKESRSIGDVPIGGIVPWAKSLAGVPNLPEGWVECDGSVLVDAQSSLNGQTIPDLNGDNRFLRGASTSGGTGGSETHTHSNGTFKLNSGGTGYSNRQPSGTDIVAARNSDGFIAAWNTGGSDTVEDMINDITGTSSATSTLPTYYGVVWIMRVR